MGWLLSVHSCLSLERAPLNRPLLRGQGSFISSSLKERHFCSFTCGICRPCASAELNIAQDDKYSPCVWKSFLVLSSQEVASNHAVFLGTLARSGIGK